MCSDCPGVCRYRRVGGTCCKLRRETQLVKCLPKFSYVLLSKYTLDLFANTTCTQHPVSHWEYIYTNKPASFVPRPSHCRLFTMYKNRGERPGQSYHVNDVNVYLGSRGVGSVPGWTWGLFLWCNSKHLPLIVQDERTCGWEMHSFDQGLPLPTLLDYLGRHWRHSCDENGPGLPPLHHHGNRVSSSLFRYMKLFADCKVI